MIAAAQPLLAQLGEVFVVVHAAGGFVVGQEAGVEIKGNIAPGGDLVGDAHRLGNFPEKLLHFLGGLDVKFVGFKIHAAALVQRAPRLKAEQHLLGVSVVAGEVVGVVGGHQRHPQLLGKLDQAFVGRHLLLEPVRLDFQIEVFLAEDVDVILGDPAGLLVVALHQRAGDLARKAGRKADQPFVVAAQQLFIHPGLDVEALGEAVGDQLAEVMVALVVFA